jgi:hypothetical protein
MTCTEKNTVEITKTPGGAAIRFPYEYNDIFRQQFPTARWNSEEKREIEGMSVDASVFRSHAGELGRRIPSLIVRSSDPRDEPGESFWPPLG